MKTASDPRHLERVGALKSLFAYSFHKQRVNSQLAKNVLLEQVKLDVIIRERAPQWPIDKIAKVDLNILRLAVFELMVAKTQPTKVIIDEAVELAKEFGGDTSASFVNGVLGTIVKKEMANKVN